MPPEPLHANLELVSVSPIYHYIWQNVIRLWFHDFFILKTFQIEMNVFSKYVFVKSHVDENVDFPMQNVPIFTKHFLKEKKP